MTDNTKHSTSYFHETIAHAFEMFKNGYEPVMEIPFQPRRLGSAFVTEYKLVRESLEFKGTDEAYDRYIEVSKEVAEAIIENQQLTIQQKWEAEEALNELAVQSQELGMYDKDNGIFDRLVESIESAQSSPEGCVSTIVEVDKEKVKVYSKSELENMEWSEFKKLIDAAGIRGRRRQNLTRDYLIYQEEIMK